jgi:hypothetical protein
MITKYIRPNNTKHVHSNEKHTLWDDENTFIQYNRVFHIAFACHPEERSDEESLY